MEKETKIQTETESQSSAMVHFILSHSYSVFLLAVVLGVIFDIFIPINIYQRPIYQYLGFGMIVVGSILIYWAQSTSSRTKKEMAEGAPRDFARGPYKYTRNPTHIGLAVMTLGLGFLINSLFSVIFIIVAFLVTKSFFLKKEEDILEEKYGQAYLDYKKKVRTWL